MKPVFALLWMVLPFSLQQFVYYPEYYYPQPPVIYYDPYAPPCCPACPLFRITYKCKQHKPTEKTSTTIPQATIQTLPHLELETTMPQTMEHSTQELPITNATETASVGRSTTVIDGREISTTVALPSTIKEIRTLETSTNPETALMTTERTDTSTTAETETSTIPREMTTEGASETVTLPSTVTEMRTLESETLTTTEVAETSTTVETSTIAREVTTEEVPGAVTTLETSTNSAATSTIVREMAVEEVDEAGTNSVTTIEAEITTGEAEVTASQKVAETINERMEFSSIGWILVSERGEDATQFKFGEETTSEYPSTEPTTFGIVVETASTEELFQNSGISEIEITMSSSPMLQYISTKSEELSTVIELGDNFMHTTEENKETTITEDVPTEIKLLPLRLSIAPQKESVATTEITAESEKNFPSEAVTHTATEVPFTTKPPRRKRTRKPKRTTTTSAPTIAVSTTTKTPVAFFPYVDAV